MINARLWKNLLNAIATLVDEANFDANDKGITLRAMDPSHVAMVDFEWPREMFDEYACDTSLKLCININEMLYFENVVFAINSMYKVYKTTSKINFFWYFFLSILFKLSFSFRYFFGYWKHLAVEVNATILFRSIAKKLYSFYK